MKTNSDPFAITAKKDRSYGRSQHEPKGIPHCGLSMAQMACGFTPTEIMKLFREDGTDIGDAPRDMRQSPQAVIRSSGRRQMLENQTNQILVEAGFCELVEHDELEAMRFEDVVDEQVEEDLYDDSDEEKAPMFEGDLIVASVDCSANARPVIHRVPGSRQPLSPRRHNGRSTARHSSPTRQANRPQRFRNEDERGSYYHGRSTPTSPEPQRPVERLQEIGIIYDPTADPRDKAVLAMDKLLVDKQVRERLHDELVKVGVLDGKITAIFAKPDKSVSVMRLLIESGARALEQATGDKPDWRAHCQLRDKIEISIGRAALPTTFMVGTDTLVADVLAKRLDEDEVKAELQLRADLRLAAGDRPYQAFGPLNTFNGVVREAEAKAKANRKSALEQALDAEPLRRFPVRLLVAVARTHRRVGQVMTKAEDGSLAAVLTTELEKIIVDDPPTVTTETAEALAVMLEDLSSSNRDSVRDTVEAALHREAQVAKRNGERSNSAAYARKNRFTRLFGRFLSERRNASAKANGHTGAKPKTSPTQPSPNNLGAPAPGRPRHRRR